MDVTAHLDNAARIIGRHRGLLLPAAAVGLVFVILVPLPPALMDVLLTANIALAALILLTTIYVSSPLEFSVFPSILLGATLFRLVLNVATTRLILTAGEAAGGLEGAQLAAGRVIWSFSGFVVSGSLAVGAIIFAIIVVIQFVVITKGAARISEVAARFVLDAMPGKQMAIDGDLSASLIDGNTARRRREAVADEADFYGAMDGASKFIRGDAIAAIIITLINILGGLYVGMVRYGWGLDQTVSLFTRLTIGDGLVTQVPAFIVSISAALLVTRTTARTNLGEQIINQLTSRPIVLLVTGGFLAALALTSLPTGPLLLIGAGCVGLAYLLSRGGVGKKAESKPVAKVEQTVKELLAVDAMRIELGYSLVRLVDGSQGGDLLDRIAALREEQAEKLGMLVPPIRIRDEMGLDAHEYAIKVRGSTVAKGRIYPGQLLAVGSEGVTGRLVGRETTEPATETPAVWIGPSQRDRAEMMNYAVVAPADVLIGHLRQVAIRNAPDLLSRQQVVGMLENLATTAPALVEEIKEKLRLSQVQKVLQNLLREGVSIRDLEAVLEALADVAESTDRVDYLTEGVREKMARSISRQHCDNDGRLYCVSLDRCIEKTLSEHIEKSGNGNITTLPPKLSQKIYQVVGAGLGNLRKAGRKPVVLCAPNVRSALREVLAAAEPDVAVMGYNEIESVEVESICSVGLNDED